MDENWDTSGRRPEQFAPDSRRVAGPATTQAPGDSPLNELREGQWWVQELDAISKTFLGEKIEVTADLKRAVAVVHHVARRPVQSTAASVYLVATGETHDGQETYTRHEGSPPPLCDSERLYTAQPKAAPAQQGDAPSSLSPEPVALPDFRDRKALLEYIKPAPFFAGLRAMFREYGSADSEEPQEDIARDFHKSCDDMCATWEELRQLLIATPPAPAAATQQAEQRIPRGEADYALMNQIMKLSCEAATANAKANSDDGHAGTEASGRFIELRWQIWTLIANKRSALDTQQAERPAPAEQAAGASITTLTVLRQSNMLGGAEKKALTEAIAALAIQQAAAQQAEKGGEAS